MLPGTHVTTKQTSLKLKTRPKQILGSSTPSSGKRHKDIHFFIANDLDGERHSTFFISTLKDLG